MHSLVNALERYIKHKPLIVGPGIKTGIKIITEAPKEIGADRIVDAVAAYDIYGGPVLASLQNSRYPSLCKKRHLCRSRQKTFRQGKNSSETESVLAAVVMAYL